MMETRNAVIAGAAIGINDDGILEAFITLDYGDSVQAFGNYALYIPKSGIEGKNCAGHFIYRVLEIAGVYKWEHLKGKAVRVMGDSARIEAIGHIITDVWFNPGKEFGQPDREASA